MPSIAIIYSNMARDYYAELDVPRDADQKQIKSAYRRLARRYHPDVNPGDDAAEDRFKRINEAYHVLSNPSTRRDYDEFGDNWKHADQIRSAGASRGFNFGAGAGSRGGSFNGIGLDDLFGGLGFGATRRQSLRTSASITLEEAYRGAKRNITISGPAACPECSGSGVDGTVLCPACGGAGSVTRPRTLEVAIPPGTASGDRIRVRPDDGTEVTIEVAVRPHGVFTRKGDDLVADVQVTYLDALLGGEVEVPTMTGRVALKVPAGTVAGRSFRLAGKGMPRRGRASNGHGDLVARVAITVPAELTDEQKGLLRRLRELQDGAKSGASSGTVGGGDA